MFQVTRVCAASSPDLARYLVCLHTGLDSAGARGCLCRVLATRLTTLLLHAGQLDIRTCRMTTSL